jgi:hypothetical protein
MASFRPTAKVDGRDSFAPAVQEASIGPPNWFFGFYVGQVS